MKAALPRDVSLNILFVIDICKLTLEEKGKLQEDLFGVGACWNVMVSIGFGDEGMSKKYAEKLNLPEGHKVNHAVILGYAKTEILRGPERKENKVTFIR